MPDADTNVPSRRAFLPTLVVSVCFGAAAGAVGTLLVLAYVAPSIALHGTTYQIMSGTAQQHPDVYSAPSGALEPAGRAAAMLAVAKTGNGPFDRDYVAGDAVGAGFVLTSDGWIITYGDGAIAKGRRFQDLVAVVGAKAYPVQRAVLDPYSGVSFLKVDAVNLPVTAFGSSAGIAPGDTLYVSDAAGGLHRLSVLAFDAVPARSSDGLLHSSERLQRMMRVDGGSLPAGAMAIDRQGNIVGIVADDGGFGSDVIPVEAFSRVIGPVLRDKEPARPFLGVHYVDLSQVASRDYAGPVRGALLAGSVDGKTAAVSRKGPADAAGLRAGDIITAVDGEQVSAKNALADALAQYAPGDAVTLTVLRARTTGETSVDVTLSAAPAP